jgi:hypothetical protein
MFGAFLHVFAHLKTKVTQSGIIIGTAAKRPKILAIRFLDWKIVDTGES